jgi:hypothetical protein
MSFTPLRATDQYLCEIFDASSGEEFSLLILAA